MHVTGPQQGGYKVHSGPTTQNVGMNETDTRIHGVALHKIPKEASFIDKVKAFFLSLFEWRYIRITNTNTLVNIASASKHAGLTPHEVRELARHGEGDFYKKIAQGVAMVQHEERLGAKVCQITRPTVKKFLDTHWESFDVETSDKEGYDMVFVMFYEQNGKIVITVKTTDNGSIVQHEPGFSELDSKKLFQCPVYKSPEGEYLVDLEKVHFLYQNRQNGDRIRPVIECDISPKLFRVQNSGIQIIFLQKTAV